MHAHVFVGGVSSIDDAASVVGHQLGGEFSVGPEGDLLLMLDSAAVNLGPHEFDDGDLAYDDGRAIPLATDFPGWFEVRDLDKDYVRQNSIAVQIFEAAKSAGWRAVATDDLQTILAVQE
ncbi:hypothetical protein NE236_25235 [Actinoallomurus purpureus]|uniref:hypothetical protein n=1 Tax=Actinoallomurus purpureus TaxID=478114 RepID=UPI00209323E3|nr:hypothetical protein [Actinoallomurus purpureus]MCO6008286.1 hypothetical protein [Actinoallomurus purpureus]